MKRYALVAGNSVYSDSRLKELRAPGRDAHALAEIFKDQTLGAFDDVKELRDPDETSLRRELALFFNKKLRDDLVVFYFSGHGVLDENGELYLATSDTDTDLVSATAVPVAFLRQQMDRSHSRRQVVLLDCCNSGAFARGAKSQLGKSVGTSSALRPEGYGRIVITASDALEYAWDGDALEQDGTPAHSVFTEAVVQGLTSGSADTNGDGDVTVDELYDYVYRRVLERGGRQKPHRFADQASGDIVVAKTRSETIRPVPLDQELLARALDPKMLIRLSAVEDLAALVRGPHKGLALSAVEQLKALADHDDSKKVCQAASDALGQFRARGQSNAKKSQPVSGAPPIAREPRAEIVADLEGQAPPRAAAAPMTRTVPGEQTATPSVESRPPSGETDSTPAPGRVRAETTEPPPIKVTPAATVKLRSAPAVHGFPGPMLGRALLAGAAVAVLPVLLNDLAAPSNSFTMALLLVGGGQGLALAFALNPGRRAFDKRSAIVLAIVWATVWAVDGVDAQSTYLHSYAITLLQVMAVAASEGWSGWPGGFAYAIGGVAVAWAMFFTKAARAQAAMTVIIWAAGGLLLDWLPKGSYGDFPILLLLGAVTTSALVATGYVAHVGAPEQTVTELDRAAVGQPNGTGTRRSHTTLSEASGGHSELVVRALIAGASAVAIPLVVSAILPLQYLVESGQVSGAYWLVGAAYGVVLALGLRGRDRAIDGVACAILAVVWSAVWWLDSQSVQNSFENFEYSVSTLMDVMAVAARQGWSGWPGGFGYGLGGLAVAWATLFRPSFLGSRGRLRLSDAAIVGVWVAVGLFVDLVPHVFGSHVAILGALGVGTGVGLFATFRVGNAAHGSPLDASGR